MPGDEEPPAQDENAPAPTVPSASASAPAESAGASETTTHPPAAAAATAGAGGSQELAEAPTATAAEAAPTTDAGRRSSRRAAVVADQVRAAARNTKSRRLDHSIKGKRVRVFWEEDKVWYSGLVKDYNEVTEMHLIIFDDGEQKEEPLNFPGAVMWELEKKDAPSDGGPRPRAKAPAPAPKVFAVEELLAQRVRSGKTQYLVSWQGYGPEENTWEDAEHVLDEGMMPVP